MTEIQPPAYLEKAGTVNTADELRRAQQLLCPAPWGVGDMNGLNDLLVQQNTGSDMNVKIARGQGCVRGGSVTDQGLYVFYNDGDVVKAIAAADATNPRIDLVVAQVNDTVYGAGSDTWALAVVMGTPGAIPVPPGRRASALGVGKVAVPALSTAVVTANITDRRAPVGAFGAYVYRTADTTNFASGVDAAVSWDGELRDPALFHDLVTNPTRVTVPTGGAGWYEADGQISWAQNATGFRKAQIRKGGSEVAVHTEPAATGIVTVVPVHMPRTYLADGDYLELWGGQASGGNLVAKAGSSQTFLEMHRVA